MMSDRSATKRGCEYLKDRKSKVENAKMPKMPLSDAEWTAIVQDMLSLMDAH